ncbi:MAG: PSD1 domain-containing protein [Acidobacteria bacterium]|nr:PSD1 domain-containing protein [Acidobacteriota bacterium]
MTFRFLLYAICVFARASYAEDDIPRQASEILAQNCLACHGAAMQMSGLDLRTRDAILKGGNRGPALVPGVPQQSRLLNYVRHTQQPAMPPGKQLPDWQVSVLSRWIATGAPLDKPVTTGDNDLKKAMIAMEERPILPEERKFWAFQPVARPTPPAVASAKAGWVRNPIDAFLLRAMEDKGLHPSPEASRRALVRRAYLDLWGLPPTPAQVDEFLSDKRPESFDKLIDKLLDSPHYGERWGRHWLDLVRYADSGGFEYDRDRHDAFRYRDWVIRAITADMPYDQFARYQLAGDEIAPNDPDALVATGFLRHGLDHNIRTEATRMDELDDIVTTTGNAFLAVTIGCARCHNHKFDPIPQKDYYGIQAVFFNTKAKEYPLANEAETAENKKANAAIDERIAPHKKQIEALKKPYRDRIIARERAKLPDYIQIALRTPEEKRTEGQKLNVRQVEQTRNFTEEDVVASMSAEDQARMKSVEDTIKQMDKSRPPRLPNAMAIAEEGRDPLPSYFLHRGSVDMKGSLMKPGVLSVAALSEPSFPAPPPEVKSTFRRKGFADWLTSPDNPLFGRVMANRIWQHHFGEGIVATPSNFGKTGDRPTHPELLDWLTSEFAARKWSMKEMHRLMMKSSAYRMASDDIADNTKLDADNKFVWRQSRQRLEGEIIRDAVLTVAGTLNSKQGGPGVHPYIDPSLWQGSSGRTWPGTSDNDPATWRRSIYVFSKRSIPLPMLDVFDKPDGITSCARRNRSTIAPQALILMNNAFVRMQAEKLAERLQREAGKNPSAQVDLAFSLALARAPQKSEKQSAVTFLKSNPTGLADFCQALFNSNEFVYMP